MSGEGSPIRLAEVLGSLSLATDLAAGQPPESVMGATVLTVRLCRAMGVPEEELAGAYYACITRMIGCTSTAAEVAPMVLGDDISLNYAINLSDPADPEDLRAKLVAEFATDAPAAARADVIDQLVEISPHLPEAAIPHCEQALALTRRLPTPGAVPDLLSHLESRWDGKNPTKKGGTEVPLIARIIEYAVIAELYRRAGGVRAAVELAQQRAGGQFDPEVCSSVEKNAPSLFEGFGGLSLWDVYLEAEPGTRLTLGGAEIRTVAEAFADFSDNKCGFLVGHSRQVASLAFLAGEVLGLDQEDRVGLSIGALLHDVGRAGVPNGVWDKPAALDRRERRMAESHSTHTENVLVSSSAFEAITELSSSVHERADGTGYHRRRSLDSLKAGIVAAADVYDALVHDRPWREAFDEARAADELIKEADSGHLPRKAVRAVLEVAGHGKRVADRAYPDGLTRREVAVLEHLARGLTTKEIAAKLSMATKTADNHIQNLYKKIGATSRTAAAMYALERGIFTN